MSKTGTRKKTTSKRKGSSRNVRSQVDRRDLIVLVVCIVLGALFFLSNIGVLSVFGAAIKNVITGLFGSFMGFVFPLGILAVSILWYTFRNRTATTHKIICAILTFIFLCAFVQLVSRGTAGFEADMAVKDYYITAHDGMSGGFVGGVICRALRVIGFTGSIIVTLILSIVFIFIMIRGAVMNAIKDRGADMMERSAEKRAERRQYRDETRERYIEEYYDDEDLESEPDPVHRGHSGRLGRATREAAQPEGRNVVRGVSRNTTLTGKTVDEREAMRERRNRTTPVEGTIAGIDGGHRSGRVSAAAPDNSDPLMRTRLSKPETAETREESGDREITGRGYSPFAMNPIRSERRTAPEPMEAEKPEAEFIPEVKKADFAPEIGLEEPVTRTTASNTIAAERRVSTLAELQKIDELHSKMSSVPNIYKTDLADDEDPIFINAETGDFMDRSGNPLYADDPYINDDEPEGGLYSRYEDAEMASISYGDEPDTEEFEDQTYEDMYEDDRYEDPDDAVYRSAYDDEPLYVQNDRYHDEENEGFFGDETDITTAPFDDELVWNHETGDTRTVTTANGRVITVDHDPDDPVARKLAEARTREESGYVEEEYTAPKKPVSKLAGRGGAGVVGVSAGSMVSTAGMASGGHTLGDAAKTAEAAASNAPAKAPQKKTKPYRTPPLNLLTKPKAQGAGNDRELRETAQRLENTLREFGVGVTVNDYCRGPAVTRYELLPDHGVKVSKITSLENDIKLNLACADLRIEAPIPGKSAVGIEVPNKQNTTVHIREVIDNEAFSKHKSKLAFAVGKNIGGEVVVGDLAKMPHVLIAGQTGSGKSVCINSLIISILYHAKPSEVGMIMIDPKIVELSVYNEVPHLIYPVVTDAKKATGILNWAVVEMDNRYRKFADNFVRDIKGYNQKLEEMREAGETSEPPMKQMVIIIDELADLMMVAPGDVETAIVRLAQKARAAGIHLVIATQRPSVNVITGLIKANVPSRIAFSVAQSVDSRTILDMNGAEKLLGMGDMLFFPSGMQKPTRVQGCFVSDEEVNAVVEFLSKMGSDLPEDVPMEINLSEGGDASEGMGGGGNASAGGSDKDDLYVQIGQFLTEMHDKDSSKKASIGMLQRKFRIGFNRAARIVDDLSDDGVLGPDEGTKGRDVVMTQAEFLDFING